MKFKITKEHLQGMLQIMGQNPGEMLLSDRCRQYLAMARWRESDGSHTILNHLHDGVMPGTVAHNLQETKDNLFGSYNRTRRLLNPLSALDPIYSEANSLKVLSIGPRTEMEIIHLIAIGFHVENIKALDLISTSPFIEVGDMHAMPYADSTFDVVISSWVIGYSKQPQVAANEMVRVCKPGGLIAIGVTYDPNYQQSIEPENAIVGSMFRSSAALLELLGNARPIFQHEPEDDIKGPVMLIARKGKDSAPITRM